MGIKVNVFIPIQKNRGNMKDMDLSSVKTIKSFFSDRLIHPKKQFGQNFLIDKSILGKIIAAAKLNKESVVLEIGPGAGVLTMELSRRAKRVLAVEKDKEMEKILKKTARGEKNVEIIREDVLKFLPEKYGLAGKKYKIVANLPYYITSPVIRKFLESENPPETIVVMVQKEVARRICSSPPDMSLLAVAVQFYAEVKIISFVSRNCFWPAPKVDSAIIEIVPRNAADKKRLDVKLFFRIARAGFSQPRKQLAGNLSKVLKKDKKSTELWLLENGIRPSQRAETLSVSDWNHLASNSASKLPPVS